MIVSGGVYPRVRRWMLCVDGENLTIRAQQFSETRSKDIELKEGRYVMRDVFLWFEPLRPRSAWTPSDWWGLDPLGIRAYYYTSVVGDSDKIKAVRQALRELDFHPEVFKKESGKEKAKGVDIALTKDMLSHAFLNNYEAAVLITGDADYIPLVTEVQRLGKLVYLAFFQSPGAGLSADLRLVCDGFLPLDHYLFQPWPSPSSK